MGDFLQGAWRLWERASEQVWPQPEVGPTLPYGTDFGLSCLPRFSDSDTERCCAFAVHVTKKGDTQM